MPERDPDRRPAMRLLRRNRGDVYKGLTQGCELSYMLLDVADYEHL
jgi:hypothetical protein